MESSSVIFLTNSCVFKACCMRITAGLSLWFFVCLFFPCQPSKLLCKHEATEELPSSVKIFPLSQLQESCSWLCLEGNGQVTASTLDAYIVNASASLLRKYELLLPWGFLRITYQVRACHWKLTCLDRNSLSSVSSAVRVFLT